MSKPIQIVKRQPDSAVYQACKEMGLSDLQCALVANRLDSTDALEEIIFPQLKHIQHPKELKNADVAAELIADAIESDGMIVLATDYDTDGVTSAWVAYNALVHYFHVPAERVIHIIGERTSGYGITDEVVDRILAIDAPISLVISADQGSSDEPRIARLKAANIAVCVTDHHHLPIEGVPTSATCTVNPQQEGCQYDKTVAGCYVIFLVLTQVRMALIQRGYLKDDAPSLKGLASNVALGTVADSVSLKSPNNRAIVRAGLFLINQFTNPAWQAMRALNDNQGIPFDAEFLGFQVATRINAASRVSDVTTAFHFLNAPNVTQAKFCLQQLDEDNQNRRQQQDSMLQQAKENAKFQYHENKYTLTVRMQGNAGIQGIIASRIGEQYGVPTIAMTDLEDGNIAGSGRGIVSDVNLREAFQWMSEQETDLFISMGGHAGAAGCMIPNTKFDRFSELFERAIQYQLGDVTPTPTIETDGELQPWQFEPELISEIQLLEPYGREWPSPLFTGDFLIHSIRTVGHAQNHLSLQLKAENKLLSAIYFNAIEPNSAVPYSEGQAVQCVYQPSLNTYRGRSNLQLKISAIISK